MNLYEALWPSTRFNNRTLYNCREELNAMRSTLTALIQSVRSLTDSERHSRRTVGLEHLAETEVEDTKKETRAKSNPLIDGGDCWDPECGA